MDSSILVIAASILSAAGAFSAFYGWSKSGEAFDPRKFVNGVITGVLAGIALVIANAAGIVNAVDQTAQFILIGSLAIAVIGVDNLRTATSQIIANRGTEEELPQ